MLPRLGMLVGVLAWLWPIGLGGKMPVGGDATQFSIGLLAFLRSSIRSGRIPLWNDLWGFGFPGVAESQMGAFYPPHLLLYGLLPVEVAYTSSLVVHTLLGALGASWASRRFGASEVGSALGGFAWATSGFFLVHLPHQWGYTVGSWMPWAWGLAWTVARGQGSRRTPWLLAAVLAIQVLPGHFQLAFVTEVGVLAIGLVGARSIGGRIEVGLALLGMVPLAAMQLWPTFRLARLSESTRDFEYLSGFAATPIHLVNYVAPGLFHRSPLWRPVAWDPFHTSPEELLNYVGIVPLFLAFLAIRKGVRTDPASRTLGVVAVLTLLLGLGPYVPGFAWLIRLPGFSFFRGPSRWGLASNLALAILAARGFDAVASWPQVGRSARRFAAGAVLAVVAVVAGFELAFASGRGNDRPAIASAFDRAGGALPWAGRPETRPFRAVMAEASRPQNDLRVRAALARLDGKLPDAPGPTLVGERFRIYRSELAEAGALLIGLMLASTLAGRPRAFSAALLGLALADGLILARHRAFDLGPARPLAEQSPVLARLAREPRGTRTLDPAQNLFLVAGVAPASAYRTLDLPSPGRLLELARGPDPSRATRAAGIALRVDPSPRVGSGPAEGEGPGEVVDDPALAGWLVGADLARLAGFRTFHVDRLDPKPALAWLVATDRLAGVDGMANPDALIAALRDAGRLESRSISPEEVEVEAPDPSPGPSRTIVLSRTFDPEWGGEWLDPSGPTRPARVARVLGGWLGVEVPANLGRSALRLTYPGRAVREGLVTSALAWGSWILGVIRSGRRRSEGTGEVA